MPVRHTPRRKYNSEQFTAQKVRMSNLRSRLRSYPFFFMGLNRDVPARHSVTRRVLASQATRPDAIVKTVKEEGRLEAVVRIGSIYITFLEVKLKRK